MDRDQARKQLAAWGYSYSDTLWGATSDEQIEETLQYLSRQAESGGRSGKSLSEQLVTAGNTRNFPGNKANASLLLQQVYEQTGYPVSPMDFTPSPGRGYTMTVKAGGKTFYVYSGARDYIVIDHQR